MSYTALVVDGRGVRLLDFHVERLAASGVDRSRIRSSLRELAPGSWTVRIVDGVLACTPRDGPGFLSDALPFLTHVSPYLDRTGRFPKPAPPNRYTPLRRHGVVTLLTSGDGAEVFETSVAMVLAWDGSSLVLPPDDRPRVDSTMERALERRVAFVRRPIFLDAGWALLAANATTGVVGVGRPLAEAVPGHVARVLDDVHRS